MQRLLDRFGEAIKAQGAALAALKNKAIETA
jgi:hypothetical protein